MSKTAKDDGALVDLERDLRALLLAREPRFVEGVPRRAQEIYRSLVRNSLLTTTLNGFPFARALVGEETATAFAARFLDEEPPTTRLLRDVPMQFATWLMERDRAGTLDPPHPAFAECVHFETAEIDVLHAPARDRGLVVDDAPTDAHVVVFDPSTRVLAYRYDVHLMKRGSPFPARPRAVPVVLLCWREAERFVWQTLSPARSTLIATLAGGARIEEALAAVPSLDAGHARALLVTLARRGAIVGFARAT